jgi:fructose-1,6-bisphosphatase-3
MTKLSEKQFKENKRFLELLANRFPNKMAARSEIINLQAILNLPKGTEHFLSDIHGEYETFKHVLSNGSGVIRRRISDIFGDTMTNDEKNAFAMLIYYPSAMISKMEDKGKIPKEWYHKTLVDLVKMASFITAKYSRSKIRKSLPTHFGYIIDELININTELKHKSNYFDTIIDSIIKNHTANEFIYEIAHLIQRMAIDRLHIVGDIYDRGPAPDKIMDELMKSPNVDIQWGNHDMVWMGAAAGIEAYIAIVLRISARYNNLDILEDAYGINLLDLYVFATDTYRDDPCDLFKPKNANGMNKRRTELLKKVHKAISIIQFKLESQIIKRNPQFGMQDRLLLENIDTEAGTVKIMSRKYRLKDLNFPTINPENPDELSAEEKQLMMNLQNSFLNSEKLQKHISFMYSHGSMYLRYNDVLMYHGAIPVTFQGNMKAIEIDGKKYKGKALMDKLDQMARQAYNNPSATLARDYMWYLWCGPNSPLFGKKKMATFERYFVGAKRTHKEERKAYYQLRENEQVIENILQEFDMDPKTCRIVNGHVPVKVVKGESPVKAKGKLIVIDGGMSEPYQNVTGIAGFTLISNSYGLVIISHHGFTSRQEAIRTGKDIQSSYEFLDPEAIRKTNAETDNGLRLKAQIKELKMLVKAFKQGYIKELYD